MNEEEYKKWMREHFITNLIWKLSTCPGIKVGVLRSHLTEKNSIDDCLLFDELLNELNNQGFIIINEHEEVYYSPIR